MSRVVDLNRYLPPVIGDAAEIREMNRVESEELNRIWEEADEVFLNRWILTATEKGLARYERMLGLAGTGDLEERRKAVHFEWNKYIVYTDRSVRQLLSQLYGPDGFLMEIYHSQYMVRFAMMIPNTSADLDDAYRRIRAILPANLGIEFAVQVQSDLAIETLFRFYAWKYLMAGERDCGTWPHTATKGLLFDAYLGADIVLEGRMQPIRRVSKQSFLTPHELIYPVEARDRTVIFNGGNAGSMDRITRTVQSGEVM